MKKKIIIICSIVLISLIAVSLYLIYAHSLEKNTEEDIKVVDKKEPEKEEVENSVDNSEKNVEEQEEENKTEEKDESYTHNSKNENKEQESYTQQTENKEETKNNNPQKTEKPTSDNQSTEKEDEDSVINQDEVKWEQFKTDPVTLMILEADAPDWESEREQQEEAKKWIDLGYRVEEPYVCINLSSGQRCVYGLVVYMSKGVCNETPTEIKIDWRKKNYIGIVAYAKSLGYECKGYQE